MQSQNFIITIRDYVYKVLYKIGYRIGHLISKVGSFTFLEGIKTAFQNNISEELLVELATESFSNTVGSIANTTLEDLTESLLEDLSSASSGSLSDLGDLESWKAEIEAEMHTEDTVRTLTEIFSSSSNPLTLEVLSKAVTSENGEQLQINNAIQQHNLTNQWYEKDLLIKVFKKSENEIEAQILNLSGQSVLNVTYEKTQDANGDYLTRVQ